MFIIAVRRKNIKYRIYSGLIVHALKFLDDNMKHVVFPAVRLSCCFSTFLSCIISLLAVN